MLDAKSGELRVALLSGEPGIGKTRLATHSALDAFSQGATVLFGRSEEDLGLPYGSWAEALAHYVENAPIGVLERHVAEQGAEVARLAPALRRRIPDAPPPRATDPETERYLLFAATVDLLTEASRQAPVVLILDDLHWADKPSLALLKHLAYSGSEAALLVIGTYRESDLSRGHPLFDLLADLRKEDGVERIALEGLGIAEVVSLMEATGGLELDRSGLALAAEITRETSGNPFFVAELLRHLDESGLIPRGKAGRWKFTGELRGLGLPQSLREVIGSRVERLGEDVAGTLRVASVIGRDFDVELLSLVTGTGEEELLEQLERAVEVSILQESVQVAGRFSFAHVLVNHTLYEELGATRRARLHRAIAEALEDRCGADPGDRVGELAVHWTRATTPAEANKAVDYSRLAGERALQKLAPDEALRWFEEALALLDQTAASDRIRRCDLLAGLGDAQRHVGLAAFRETLLEAARIAVELGDGDRLARAVLANTRGFTSVVGQVDHERIALLEQALELVDDRSKRAAVLSLLAMELTYGADLERRIELSQEALQLARETGDEATLAWVLGRRFFTVGAPKLNEEMVSETAELVALASRLNDPVLEFWAAVWRGCAAVQNADIQEFDRCVDRQVALAERVGQPVIDWVSAYVRASQALFRGALDASESLAERAAQLGAQAGQSDALAIYGAQLFLIRFEQGRLAELVDLIGQAASENPRLPGFRAAQTLAYCELDRHDEARASLEEFYRGEFAHITPDIGAIAGLAIFSEAAAQLREREAAAALYELLRPWSGLVVFSGPIILGSFDIYLGRLALTLGRHDEAEQRFTDAAELNERLGAPSWLARTHLFLSETLFERGGPGDSERAQEFAERAAATAGKLGFGAIEERATRLLGADTTLGSRS